MINVSSEFKAAMKASAKTLSAYIDDGDAIRLTDADDLKGWTIRTNGNLFQTVLRQAEAVFWGTHDLRGKTVNIGLGVVVGEGVETIDYGTFSVVEQVEDKETGQNTIKAYDKMYEALRKYELYSIEYPLTLKQYIEEICSIMDWTLGTDTFLNEDLILETDVFAFKGYTFRDVLDQIAEITATIIYFNHENKLILKALGDTIDETLTLTDLRKLKTELEWGEVNSISLARTPVEQDFVWRGGYTSPPILLENGEELLLENGEELLLEVLVEMDNLYQFRFDNNMIVDEDREAHIDSLADVLMGFKYTPFEANTIFLGYFEIGDKVVVEDREGNGYETYILNTELSVGGAVKEVLSATEPSKGRGSYKKEAGVITQTVTKMEIDGSRNIRDESIPSAKIKELSADKITPGNIKATQHIGVVDSYNQTRVLMGDRGDANYGISVYDEQGETILDETKLRMQYVFSTQMESASVNWMAVVGFMTYDTTAYEERNLAVRLDFVKPENFVITDVQLYYKFVDFIDTGALS